MNINDHRATKVLLTDHKVHVDLNSHCIYMVHYYWNIHELLN